MLKAFRLTKIMGDRFAGEWPREAFRSHGIAYNVAARPVIWRLRSPPVGLWTVDVRTDTWRSFRPLKMTSVDTERKRTPTAATGGRRERARFLHPRSEEDYAWTRLVSSTYA